MRRIVGSATLGVISLLLAGCPGHISVSVPALAINAESVNVSDIDLLCPNFYAEPETFVAVVTHSLEHDARHYDWKRIPLIPATSTRGACRSERRYIGFPVIAFVPAALFRPSSKVANGRRLFVHVDNENVLYRIGPLTDSVRVESISLEVAQNDFPRELNGPEPRVSTPAWNDRLRLTAKYYWALKWQRSDRIAINNVEMDSEGAVRSIRMSIGMTANQALERPGAFAPSDTEAASAGRSPPGR